MTSYAELFQKLKLIEGIKFTQREIDVLAFIFNGRSPKVIGSFLSISTRTVEAHLHNAMMKIGCTSRQNLINFIENSQHSETFRQYYYYLLRQSNFEVLLKKLTSIFSQERIEGRLIINKKSQSFPENFICILERDLKKVGIPIELIKKNNAMDPIVFTWARLHKGTRLFSEKYELNEKDFEKNYYSAFLNILKKVLPHHSFDHLFKDFLPIIKNKEERDFSYETINGEDKNQKNISLRRLSQIFLIFLLILCVSVVVFYGVKKQGGPLFSGRNDLIFRSDLRLPHESYFLNRPSLIEKIHTILKRQHGIKTVAIVGTGGSGKTTLAHQYALTQSKDSIFVINASSQKSIIASFKDLAYLLAYTPELKSELDIIQHIKNHDDKEKQIFLFVKNRLKKINWLLIFDNVETFSEIKEYIPMDPNIWGEGSIILTTQDSNLINTSYITSDSVIPVGELMPEEALDLFTKILSDSESTIKEDRTNLSLLIKEIPPFPLDISIAAYYIKNTHIPYDHYFQKIKEFQRDFEADQENILKEVSDYNKTRYGIIINSLEKIIAINPAFKDLLTFIFLLDSQDIPIDLLENFKDFVNVNQLIYQLKKYSLITKESPSTNQLKSSFSFHRSTQKIGEHHIIKGKEVQKNEVLMHSIYTSLKDYASKIMDKNDLQKLKFVSHLEAFLSHENLLTQEIKDNLNLTLGGIYLNLNHYLKTKKIFEENLKNLSKFSGKNHLLLSCNLEHLGNTYKYLGDYKKAQDLLEKSLFVYEKSSIKDDIVYANILMDLGKIFSTLRDFEKAQSYMERSLLIYKEASPNSYNFIANILNNLGAIHRFKGNYKKAKILLQESFTIYKENLGENCAGFPLLLQQLGALELVCGHYKEAQKFFGQSLNLYIKNFPENKKEISHITRALGYSYRKLGDLGTAQKLFEQSFLILKKNFPEGHPESAWILTQLGIAKRILGDYKKAQDFLEKSSEIFKKNYSPMYVERAWTLAHLGIVARELGQYEKAKRLFKESELIYLASLPKAHGSIAWLLTELGKTYMKEGQYEKAYETLEQSHQFFKTIFGEDNIKTSWASVSLAEVYIKLKKYDKAKVLLEKSLEIHKKELGDTHPHITYIKHLLRMLKKN